VSRNRQEATPERHQVLREMLEDRRRELERRLRLVLETLPEETGPVREPEEQSVRDFAREVEFTLAQMRSDTLLKIDDALHRLEEGSYGRCADCGTEIPPSRLTALPFAERCRGCQEQHELGREGRPSEGHAEVGARLRDALAPTPDRGVKND
jgi:DnaK suppressor protein